jgi:hypothetical protein
VGSGVAISRRIAKETDRNGPANIPVHVAPVYRRERDRVCPVERLDIERPVVKVMLTASERQVPMKELNLFDCEEQLDSVEQKWIIV